MPTARPFVSIVLAVSLASAGSVPLAAAHTAGGCQLDQPTDRCELWAQVYDDPTIQPPNRSDQFVTATATNHDTVFVTVKNVALDPDDPYAATGSWVVLAYDAATGDQRWRAERATRAYDMPLDVAVAPDGSRVYVTGAAYDAFSVAATDSRVVTVAYDAATGAELWSQEWDNRIDATDNGKVIAVSADGRQVYVGGVTTTPSGDLDYLTLAYDSQRGRPLWTSFYAGPAERGTDAVFDIEAAPDGAHVYVTGWSGGTVEYDADYATLAIRTARGRGGSIAWTARYDGVQANKSDRANALTVAPDGTVLVTGDSYSPTADGGIRYDVATVRYDGDTGGQLWEARYAGPRRGLDSGVSVAATGTAVAVTAQSVGETEDSGHDAATVAYDLATGEQRWAHREDQPRSSELPNSVAVSPDGSTAYMLSAARPVVDYTSLNEIVLHAYRMSDGAEMWTSRLDAGAGNAVTAKALAVLPDGRIAIAGQVTWSQSPLGPPSQNRYDALTALYTPLT